MEQLDAFAIVVAWHRKEDGILEAKGTFRDEPLLMLIILLLGVFFANKGGLGPDLIDGSRGALG